MKNRFTLSALALLVAGSAHAWTDVGAFDGTLNWQGTITNDTADWEWEVPEATKTAMTGLTANRTDGIIVGDNWTFEQSVDVAYLNGRMTEAAAGSGGLLLPEVTVNSTGDTVVTLTPQAENVQVILAATGEAGETTGIAGSLTLDLGIGAATAAQPTVDSYSWTSADNTNPNNVAAIALLTAAPAFTAIFDGQTNTPSAPGTGVNAIDPISELRSNAGSNLVGVYQASIKKLLVSFPQATLPETWTAQLQATITLK